MKINIQDIDINYIQYGKGKDIVLLHGWGQNIAMMKPLGDNFQDKYRITISDSNIESFFIVLNSESGDAQLSVYKEKETSYNKESLISISSHNDYIPDVVRVTPKKIGQENLVGKYIIKVYKDFILITHLFCKIKSLKKYCSIFFS